jgi:hypothetical protein
MNLSQRLQSELIGEDETWPPLASDPELAIRNDLRKEQRKTLPKTVATIASDLKGMAEQINHEQGCAWVWRHTDECNCHKAKFKAAVDRYCGLTGEEKSDAES